MIFYMPSWTVTVNARNRVGHPLKDICSCWQEFGGNQWRSHHFSDAIVFRLNKEDLGREHCSPYKEDIGLRLGSDMQQILPVTVHNCKEFLQQRCVSHMKLIVGCVVGKLAVSGAASVCTSQWNPHLMFRFSDLKSVLLVLNSLHWRFCYFTVQLHFSQRKL
jgi:hypothetical protein